jgi:hypothetical protein
MSNKYIPQLPQITSPLLSGDTIYDDGVTTYKMSLSNLKNLISVSKEVLTFSPPNLDDVIVVTTNANETYVIFSGNIINNFTFNLNSGINTQIGDKVFLFLSSSNGCIVTFTGNINVIGCGTTQSDYTMKTNVICFTLIYDGNNYTGIDTC